MIKRLVRQVDGPRSASAYNNAREHFSDPDGRLQHQRQPDADAVRAARSTAAQFAPTPSVPAGIFMNAKWQFNANGMYQAPYGIELAAQRLRPAGLSVPDLPRRDDRHLRLRHGNLNVLVSPTLTLPPRQRVGHRHPRSRSDVPRSTRAGRPSAFDSSPTSSTCSTRTPSSCGNGNLDQRRASTRSRRT